MSGAEEYEAHCQFPRKLGADGEAVETTCRKNAISGTESATPVEGEAGVVLKEEARPMLGPEDP